MTSLFYLDQLFDDMIENFFSSGSPRPRFNRTLVESSKFPNYPVSNIFTNKNGDLVLEIAVTGMSDDQVKVEVEKNRLYISGKGPLVDKDDDREYLCHRLATRDFEMTYQVSNLYDLQKAEVSMKNGILNIKVPIQPQLDKPERRMLEIK